MFTESQLNSIFGKPGTNIISATVPILGTIKCNKIVYPQIYGFLDEVKKNGLSYLISLDEWRRSGGCYVYRQMRGSTRLSHHSWGGPLDINAETYPWKSRKRQDRRLIIIANKWGFINGEEFSTLDPMHFEPVRIVKKEELIQVKHWELWTSNSVKMFDHVNEEVVHREAFGAIGKGGYDKMLVKASDGSSTTTWDLFQVLNWVEKTHGMDIIKRWLKAKEQQI